MQQEFLTRIAPTPSGFLHKGNAFNFLLTKHLAENYHAKIIMRIDDLDAQRVRDEFLEDIFQSLEWLGIEWNVGPAGVDDFKKNWSQSLRMESYRQSLRKLRDKHLLFACTCSRKQLEGFDVYPKTCLQKGIPLDAEDVAWRIMIQDDALQHFTDEIKGETKIDVANKIGCAVLRRRDGIPAYHIASLTDDEKFGVNLVVRGEDLLHSTAFQLQLANKLGYEKFSQAKFFHHPLLQKPDGEKLSKSKDDTSLKFMRENGMKATDLKLEFYNWLNNFL